MNFQKYRSMIFIIMLLLLISPNFTIASSVPLRGTGSFEDPYLIETSKDLEELAKLEAAITSSSYFKLVKDIVYDKEWEAFDFNGVIDGNNKKIVFQEFKGTSEFGFIKNLGENGVVKRLAISGDISLNSEAGEEVINIGALVVNNYGEIKSVKFEGALILSIKAEVASIGGLVANNYSRIEKSENIGVINLESSNIAEVRIGGISGTSESSNAVITRVVNKSDIVVNAEKAIYLGGVVGHLNNKSSVLESINYGNMLAQVHLSIVSSLDVTIGGVVGYASNAIIDKVENKGVIISQYLGRDADKVSNYAGGIAGELSDRSVIRNSKNINSVYIVNGNQALGAGIAALADNSVIYNSFNTGDIISKSSSVRHRIVATGIASGQVIAENCYSNGKTGVIKSSFEEVEGSSLFDLNFTQSLDKIQYCYWPEGTKAIADKRKIDNSSAFTKELQLINQISLDNKLATSLLDALNQWSINYGPLYDTWIIEDEIITFGEIEVLEREEKKLSFIIGQDTNYGKVELIDGTTMVPLRFVEDLGVNVKWMSLDKKAIYTYEDIRVEVTIEQEEALVNNLPVQMIEKAYLNEHSRMMVPLRMISEELGFKVHWISNSSPITIVN